MYKLLIPPDQPSYTVKDGKEVVYTQLDGGAGRYRRDIIGASSFVTAQWTTDREGWLYLRAFYNTATKKGSLPFLVDLLIDSYELTEHTAYFIPDTMTLSAQSGFTFTVTATLEVVPITANEFSDEITLLFYETGITTSEDAEDLLDALAALVNEDAPDALWTPAVPLSGNAPLMWLDANWGVYTGNFHVDASEVTNWYTREGNARKFTQSSTKRPLLRLSGINSLPAIDFDGTDDILVCASAFLTGTQGTVVFVYYLDSIAGAIKTVLASCDEAAATRYITFEGRSSGNKLQYQQANADTGDIVSGNTTIAATTKYAALIQSNGTAIAQRLNGVAQSLSVGSGSNAGDWFSDTANIDNVTVGGYKLNAEGNFFNGKIAEILVYPHVFSADDLDRLGTYINNKYGVAL